MPQQFTGRGYKGQSVLLLWRLRVIGVGSRNDALPQEWDHVNAILLKIGAANRTEAVAIALRKHLLKI